MTQRVHFWKGKRDQQTLSQINKWNDKKTPNKKIRNKEDGSMNTSEIQKMIRTYL